MATSSEITGLALAVARADEQINAALDLRDRRQFRAWCKRRASLLTRIETALLALASAKVTA